MECKPLVLYQAEEILARMNLLEQLKNIRLLTPYLSLLLEDMSIQALAKAKD